MKKTFLSDSYSGNHLAGGNRLSAKELKTKLLRDNPRIP